MSHQVPPADSGGTERARQTEDPALPAGERGPDDSGPSPAPRPMPWIVPALVLAAVLVLLLLAGLLSGLATAVR